MKKIAVLMSNPVQYYSIQPLLEALDVVSIGYDGFDLPKHSVAGEGDNFIL